jgi:hypothetical protein
MFDDALIQQLARELHQAEKTRVQVEHFSKRHPGMTVQDGYAISRAWVAMKIAEGRTVRGHKIGLTSRAMQVASQILTSARCWTTCFLPKVATYPCSALSCRAWRWSWPSCSTSRCVANLGALR